MPSELGVRAAVVSILFRNPEGTSAGDFLTWVLVTIALARIRK